MTIILTPDEQARYEEALKKDVQVGKLVYIHTHYQKDSGVYRVGSVELVDRSVGSWGRNYPARLVFRGRRVVDANGVSIKNSKIVRTYDVSDVRYVIDAEYIDNTFESEIRSAESRYKYDISAAEQKRDRLMAML